VSSLISFLGGPYGIARSYEVASKCLRPRPTSIALGNTRHDSVIQISPYQDQKYYLDHSQKLFVSSSSWTKKIKSRRPRMFHRNTLRTVRYVAQGQPQTVTWIHLHDHVLLFGFNTVQITGSV